jgi:hypothetical protein
MNGDGEQHYKEPRGKGPWDWRGKKLTDTKVEYLVRARTYTGGLLTLIACPITSSALPLAYTSALSKKLTPALKQASKSSLAVHSATHVRLCDVYVFAPICNSSFVLVRGT